MFEELEKEIERLEILVEFGQNKVDEYRLEIESLRLRLDSFKEVTYECNIR